MVSRGSPFLYSVVHICVRLMASKALDRSSSIICAPLVPSGIHFAILRIASSWSGLVCMHIAFPRHEAQYLDAFPGDDFVPYFVYDLRQAYGSVVFAFVRISLVFVYVHHGSLCPFWGVVCLGFLFCPGWLLAVLLSMGLGALYVSPGMPSCPCDLLFFSCCMVVFASSSVESLVSHLFIWWCSAMVCVGGALSRMCCKSDEMIGLFSPHVFLWCVVLVVLFVALFVLCFPILLRCDLCLVFLFPALSGIALRSIVPIFLAFAPCFVCTSHLHSLGVCVSGLLVGFAAVFFGNSRLVLCHCFLSLLVAFLLLLLRVSCCSAFGGECLFPAYSIFSS